MPEPTDTPRLLRRTPRRLVRIGGETVTDWPLWCSWCDRPIRVGLFAFLTEGPVLCVDCWERTNR